MEFTRTSPIQFNITPISNSILNLKFKVKGSREITRVDLFVVIYFKNPYHRTMTDMFSSDMLSLYTFTEDREYKALLKIPEFEFKNYKKSFIYFTVNQIESLYKKVSVENIIVEFSFQKLDYSVIEEMPLHDQFCDTKSIDQLQFQPDTFKIQPTESNSKNKISYIYSLYGNESFSIVASNHIKYLRLLYENKKRTDNDYVIEPIDWSQLGNISWNEKRNFLLHPFLYPFASIGSFEKNSRNFSKLLKIKNKIGGLDVADSNKISSFAVNLVNKIDLMIVPSGFSRDAYISSGVNIPVEILPHGIPDEFLKDEKNFLNTDFNNDLIKLKKLKEEGNILILYFLIHSEHRKGADLVRNVMKRIQKKFKNIYLVIKGPNRHYFNLGINTVNIQSWMNNDELRSLYDICDICLSPSRGGGFELNALEAASRGIPTLVTNGGCFLDLINYFIPINLSNIATKPLPGNAIHIGYGFEPDIEDLELKLTDTINRLEYWKNHSKSNIEEIRYKYSWKNVGKIFDNHLRNYEFVE